MSPILCIVYFDELIILLKKRNIGCHIGSHFIGALGYADDLTLLSPSLSSLNEMLKICETFAQEYNVTFNAKKTVCIKYGSKIMEYDKLYIGNQVIEWSDKVKHLGNTIVNCKLSDDDDCALKMSHLMVILTNYWVIMVNYILTCYVSYLTPTVVRFMARKSGMLTRKVLLSVVDNGTKR